jgi:hypothetical protein
MSLAGGSVFDVAVEVIVIKSHSFTTGSRGYPDSLRRLEVKRSYWSCRLRVRRRLQSIVDLICDEIFHELGCGPDPDGR